MTKKRVDNIIRDGDHVIIPKQQVLRVGYPKGVGDYVKDAEALLVQVPDLAALRSFGRDDRGWTRVVNNVAYLLLHRHGFGGGTRSVHMADTPPEHAGKIGRVFSVRTAQTGTYRPGRRGGGYEYDEGDEPADLQDRKTVRIATLSPVSAYATTLMFLVSDLVKVVEP